MLGSNPNSCLHELGQPLGAMSGSIDCRTAAGNALAAVQGFDPIHYAGHILGDRQIAPPQLFQGAYSMLFVVHRLELVRA